MSAKNFADTRHSALDQINAENVADLHVAFTFSTGVNWGQEAAPIVAGYTMYLVTPFPNILYALDSPVPAHGSMEVPAGRSGGAGGRLLRYS